VTIHPGQITGSPGQLLPEYRVGWGRVTGHTFYFPEFRMQQYKQRNSGVHNAYMDIKGPLCRHLHSTNKTKKWI